MTERDFGSALKSLLKTRVVQKQNASSASGGGVSGHWRPPCRMALSQRVFVLQPEIGFF